MQRNDTLSVLVQVFRLPDNYILTKHLDLLLDVLSVCVICNDHTLDFLHLSHDNDESGGFKLPTLSHIHLHV